VQSQLRSKLILELRLRASSLNLQPKPQSSALVAPGSGGGSRTLCTSTVLTKIADSLISDYLQYKGYEFSLSVFIPESGIGGPAAALKDADVQRILNLVGGGERHPGLRLLVRGVL
jgi:hypothetical protein